MMTKRISWGLVLGLGVLLSAVGAPGLSRAQNPQPVPLPRGDDAHALVVLTGGAVVLPTQTFSSVVVFNGPVFVAGDVQNDVVAMHGNVRVAGRVGGNVVALNGKTLIGPFAQVGGDLVGAEAPVIVPGAVVGGQTRITGARGAAWASLGYWTGHLAIWAAVGFSVLLLGLLLAWVAPRAAEAVFLAGRTATATAIGAGIVVALALPAAAVLALVTFFGIPLGLWLLLGLGFLSGIGYTAGAFFLGRLIVRKHPGRHVGPFLVGWLILRAIALIPIINMIAWVVVSVWGAGTMAVAVARARRGRALSPVPVGAELPPPGPPPTPPTPAIAPPTPTAA